MASFYVKFFNVKYLTGDKCPSSLNTIRAASASKAKLLCIPIDNILKSSGWSSARTFAKFYDKQVEAGLDFQAAVLS
jgi:hypothetical protein